MDATSMAERRRAARQRKILENAQNRMNRLYGRPDEPEPSPDTDAGWVPAASSADHCPDPPDQSIDEVLGRSQPATVPGWPAGMPPPNIEDLFRQLNGQGPAAAGTAGSSAATGPESVWWSRWDRHRWIAVSLLAVLTRLAILTGVGTALTQNVLVPFLVLQTTVYVVRLCSVPLRSNMGLLGSALMLCGVSPRTLDLWGRYFTFLCQAWGDFMIYLFVLVISFQFGRPALAADAATTASAGGPEVAAPPPPDDDDQLEFEF